MPSSDDPFGRTDVVENADNCNCDSAEDGTLLEADDLLGDGVCRPSADADNEKQFSNQYNNRPKATVLCLDQDWL